MKTKLDIMLEYIGRQGGTMYQAKKEIEHEIKRLKENLLKEKFQMMMGTFKKRQKEIKDLEKMIEE